MRILFADALPETCLDAAARAGWEITNRPDLDAASLVDAIPGHEVVVVRSTPVTPDAISAGDRLELIVRAGAGTNTIAVDAAADRAISVSNVPGRNAVAVAELTMGLIMSIDRDIPANVEELRRGQWDKKRFSQAKGLYGRTLGIVGLGSIGLAVAERAAGFGMRLMGMVRPGMTGAVAQEVERLDIELVPSLAELAASVDVVTFHVPLTDENRGMIDSDFLAHLREGAVLINTSRAELVEDEETFVRVVEEKGLRVGLDVFQSEPATGSGGFVSRLAQHPRVYGTHHIGASTWQAQEAVGNEVIEVIRDHERGIARNAVNLVDTTGVVSLIVRHRNEVGVLSAVLAEIRAAGINVEEMENRIFAGGTGALARISLGAEPSPDVVATIGSHPQVLGVATMPIR